MQRGSRGPHLNGDDPANDESGINLAELTGTAAAGLHPTSISNSVFTNNEEFQVQITNTSGTLTDFQFTNNTVTGGGLTSRGLEHAGSRRLLGTSVGSVRYGL